MGDEDERERLQQIRQLTRDLAYYRGLVNEEEKVLKKCTDDYKSYDEAIQILSKVKGQIMEGQGEIDSAGNGLAVWADGNKANMARGAIGAVSGMFGSTAGSVDTIVQYAKKDMELLNEKYMKEHTTYMKYVEAHNRVVRNIWSLNGSASIMQPSITKPSLA